MSLLDHLHKFPSLNELSGSFGEWLAKSCVKTYSDALVLNDVLISGSENYTSQIDLLMIGAKGIYVIEVKLFPDAKIYGRMDQSKWYYYNHGRKYDIYSPIKQNQKHIQYLKDFLREYGDVPCFSIIAMICDDFKISGHNEHNAVVCNSLPSLKKAIEFLAERNPVVFDDCQKQAIYEHIKNNQIIGKKARFEHKQQVIEYKSNLERKEEQKICPYCNVELVLRKGKYGEFYSCANYPKCKYTLKA